METKPDPWDWTVDEVVQEFCYARTLWKAGYPAAPLPDPALLERALRENYVEGGTLLSQIGESELKDELGIKAIGHRAGLKWGILQLQGRSEKYISEQQSSSKLEQVIKSETPASTPVFRSFSATPGHPFSPGLPTIQGSPARTTLSRQEEGPAVDGAAGASKIASKVIGALGDLPIKPDESSKRQSSPGPEQANSRKKRKLNLAPPTPLPKVSFLTNQLPPGDSASTTLVQLPTRSWLSGIVSQKHSYLGPRKLTPDDIFFGSGGLSKLLNPDVDMKPLTEDGTEPSDFQIISLQGRSIPGRQRYVYRQMLHFLRQPLLEVTRHGQRALAVFPYAQSASAITDSRSALVFTSTDGGVEATREKAAALLGDTPRDDTMETNSNHEWDFLLQRHGKDPSEELPVYGESEHDTEMSDLVREIEEEEQAEKEPDETSRGPLSKEKVIDVIDEEISGYVATWERQKLPLREHSAWKAWKKDSRDRRSALDRERLVRLNSSDRLSKLKDSITDEIWISAKAVRDQCKSLEQTVIQQEEARFKVTLLQRTNPPPRPAQAIKSKKKSARPLSTADQDDISLDSDSEVATETQSLNGFMEIDDDEPVAFLDLTQRVDPDDSVTGIDDDMGDAMDGDEDMVADHVDARSDKDSVFGGKTDPGATASRSSADTEPQHEDPVIPDSLKRSEPFNVIDLTSDTEETAPAPTVPKRPEMPISTNQQWGKSPLKDLDEDVLQWDIDILTEREDYKRILIKLLRTMPKKEFSELYNYVTPQKIPQVVKLVEEQIEIHSRGIATHEEKLGAKEVLRLYLCWVKKEPDHFKHTIWNDGSWCFLSDIKTAIVQEIRKTIQRTDNKSLKDFCVFLARFYDRYDAPIDVQDMTVDKESVESASESDSSDDELDPEFFAASQNTSHKKRKKKVAESQNAKEIRERTRRTQLENAERASLFLHQQSSQLGDQPDKIIVNPGKKDDEDAIYINEYIAGKIQPHQVDGVRFLWTSIVASTEKEEDMQGCLLAHTMGLGKTMQAITFLVTIAEACADPKLRSQVPKSLRKQRNLIICPSSLIFNWESEFGMWNKNNKLGGLWSIDATMSIAVRLNTLQTWHEKTGVLIVSYDFIRMILENKVQKKSGTSALTASQYAAVKEQLLHGTSLIIADEAHAIKNLGSGISKAVKLFRTKSRVALTGSPLSNNLQEYYAMAEWISPGYLGDQVEFKAHFVEPIEQGNDMECTTEERRTSRKKLKALQDILDPKIHRREVNVLKGSLKPKTEFMIKVPLTNMQFEAYLAFFQLFCRAQKGDINKKGDVNNTRLWSWMNKLGLLCGHPWPFWQSLLEDNKGNKSPQKTSLDQDADTSGPHEPSTENIDPANDETESADTGDIEPVKIAPELMEKLRSIFAATERSLEDVEHSNKSALLLQLLKYCIKAGDKVLVFSQSIATLNFLEKVLTQNYVRYFRLDGKTKMNQRPTMIKEFNRNGSEYDVFLISTKAGGLGFNLPGANRVIIYDFSFNPTHEEQAIGRAYRLGQPKPVFVYRFISAGTYEENLHNTTVFKIQLAYRVVERRNTKALATRQNEWLRDPVRVEQHELSEHLGKDIKVLDRVIHGLGQGTSSTICDIKTTETLQEESEEVLTLEEEAEVKRMVADERKRVDDPVAWQAELSRRRTLEHQEILARQQQANLASPRVQDLAANSVVIPPSTFQVREREAFHVNGLPSGLPSTAPPMASETESPLRLKNGIMSSTFNWIGGFGKK